MLPSAAVQENCAASLRESGDGSPSSATELSNGHNGEDLSNGHSASVFSGRRPLGQTDFEMHELLRKTRERQKRSLNLVASENLVSAAVQEALGSSLGNHYGEGYLSSRTNWLQSLNRLESVAKRRALAAFRLNPADWAANVQPHSGSNAVLAALLGSAGMGGRVLALDPNDGGHHTHGTSKEPATRLPTFPASVFDSHHYRTQPSSGLIAYRELEKKALVLRPKVITAGGNAYPRLFDYGEFGRIAKASGALLIVDLSHTAGPIAAKLRSSPFPFADVVVMTTSKSLRGPHAGIILVRRSIPGLVDAVDRALYPGVQSGPHWATISAVAVAMREAESEEFAEYQRAALANAKELAVQLSLRGRHVLTGGTDTHIVILKVEPLELDLRRTAHLLELANVGLSLRPAEDRPQLVGKLRLGTNALTSRGASEASMSSVAALVDDALRLASKHAPTGETFDEFAAFIEDSRVVRAELAELRERIENEVFPLRLPGLEDI